MRLLRDEAGWLTGLGFALMATAAIIGLTGMTIAIVAPVANHSGHVACLRLHEQTGLATRYARSGMDGECYIQVADHWIPEERWRALGDTP